MTYCLAVHRECLFLAPSPLYNSAGFPHAYSFEDLSLLLLVMGVESRRGKQDVVIQSRFIPRDTEYCRRDRKR